MTNMVAYEFLMTFLGKEAVQEVKEEEEGGRKEGEGRGMGNISEMHTLLAMFMARHLSRVAYRQ